MKRKKKIGKQTNAVLDSLTLMVDNYLNLLESDNEDIKLIFKGLSKCKKSDYTREQLKELKKLNADIEDMDKVLKDIGGLH